MTPAFRRAIKDKPFKKIFYHTKEKPIIPLFITIILWLLATLHTELNWQVLILWITAISLTIKYWSWKVALLLFVASFGTQNELAWIQYTSLGIFSLIVFFTFISSSYVSSSTSFAISSQSSKDKDKEKDKSNEGSDLWTE